MSPTFLTIDEVLAIHKDQLDRYGGSEGIRDVNLLKSALAQPEATFGGDYLHNDLFEMAAAYLFHLVQNHAFIDGNKRVGAVTAIVFLRMNDMDVEMTNEELESLVLSVAKGEVEKEQIGKFLRDHSE